MSSRIARPRVRGAKSTAAPAARPAAHALRRAEELATTFKMLSNANRLKIIVFLGEQERSVASIEEALRIHQPTLSQQLGELRDAGLIAGRKVAKSVIYALTEGPGSRALDTVYLANGYATSASIAAPKSSSLHQAAQFAAVLSARGASSEWQPGFNTLLEE